MTAKEANEEVQQSRWFSILQHIFTKTMKTFSYFESCIKYETQS